MKRIYEIVYSSNNALKVVVCTEGSLATYIKSLISKNNVIMYIVQKEQTRIKVINSINCIEKAHYYKREKENLRSDYLKKKIDAKTLSKTLEILDDLKSTCKTKEELEIYFKQYKKY